MGPNGTIHVVTMDSSPCSPSRRGYRNFRCSRLSRVIWYRHQLTQPQSGSNYPAKRWHARNVSVVPVLSEYADILTERGVDRLDIVEQKNYAEPKQCAGIPRELWACHTITTEGYALEGHLPVEAIEKLAIERPAIIGVVLPGMPA